MNRLHFTSPLDSSATTLRFQITLWVRNFPNLGPSKFSFKPNLEVEKDGVNIARDDMVHNYTKATTQAMNKVLLGEGHVRSRLDS